MNIFQSVIIFILTTLMGIMNIRYGIKLPNSDKKWKWKFIGLGCSMIILGMVIIIIDIIKHNI